MKSLNAHNKKPTMTSAPTTKRPTNPAQRQDLTACAGARSVTASDTLATVPVKLSGIKTACLPMTTKPYRIAIRAVSILCREGIGIREAEIFLNADYKTAVQIAGTAGQLLPNVRNRLYVLSKKGIIAKTKDRLPRWHWTDRGTQIMQEINGCAT